MSPDPNSRTKVRMWHGFPIRRDWYDLSRIGEGNTEAGAGFYFTSDPRDARRYGKFLHEVEIDVSRALWLGDKKRKRLIRDLIRYAPNSDDTLQNWDYGRDETPLMTATNSIYRGTGDAHDSYQQVWYDFYRGHESTWAGLMTHMVGHDCYIVPLDKKAGTRHIVVWNPYTITTLSVEEIT